MYSFSPSSNEGMSNSNAYTHLAVMQAESTMPRLFSTILPCTVILFSEWPLQNYSSRYACKDV